MNREWRKSCENSKYPILACASEHIMNAFHLQYNSDEYILKKRLKGKETLLVVPYPNMWCRTHIYIICYMNAFHDYNAFGLTAFWNYEGRYFIRKYKGCKLSQSRIWSPPQKTWVSVFWFRHSYFCTIATIHSFLQYDQFWEANITHCWLDRPALVCPLVLWPDHGISRLLRSSVFPVIFWKLEQLSTK